MAKIPFRALNGVLLIDKARGVSSNKTLQTARFAYRARKAGHTGTLDPFATGLLPVCFGEANKYSRWLLDADKTYCFTAVLGQQSTTGDTEGDISIVDESPTVSERQLCQAASHFLGEIEQIPPKFSAIKIGGQRAYKLAREGKHFSIPSRRVHIHKLSLSLADNKLTGVTRVSKGTYIRTLVEDIANYLGTVAYCSDLRRLQIANLVNEAQSRVMHTIADIDALPGEAERDTLLLPMDLLCHQFPPQTILSTHWDMLIRGRQTCIDSDNNGIVRLYIDDKFCGLGQVDQGRLKAFRLLNTGY
ncbi:MAG: tRNA pseudouridine(55) synthase TruB [Gammaproteobacteria bacterium]|nr:MAG: tRNA pseudouridine(55) synthase TruB [Gammaproteobacteria bacterium]